MRMQEEMRERSPREGARRLGTSARSALRSPTLWALIAALLLAMLFGRAAMAHFQWGIVGGKSDGYENAWNDYWLRTALFHLHRNPFFTTYVEYPTGASLRFHTLNPFGGLIALPLMPLIGPIATINLKMLLALAGSTFFAYLLMKDLTGSTLAACAGAAVYTYANDQVILDYRQGTVNYLMGTALLPLTLFFLFRAATRARWRRDATAAIIVLLALCLTDWQYTLFAVLIASLFFLFTALTTRKVGEVLALLRRFAVIGGLWAAIILLPLVLPMLREAHANPWLSVSESAATHARSIAQFFQFGVGNPGYPVLAVIVVGLILLWRRDAAVHDRKTILFWGIVAAFGIVLSLGPRLELAPGTETALPLPYALWYRLPIASIGRKPFLFYASLGMLGIGVLLAFAVREIVARVRGAVARRAASRAGSRSIGRVVPGLLVGALLAVTLAPFLADTRQAAVTPPQWPPFYRDVLARDPASYAILELPLFTGYDQGRAEGLYNAYQIMHGKYRFSSSLARDHKADNPNLIVKQGTLFRDAFWFDKATIREGYRPTQSADFLATPAYPDLSVPLLNYYHVRYIVLYLDALRDTSPTATGSARAFVRQAIGANAQPVYTDNLMEAYRVPDAPPLANPLFLDTGSSGWWPAEKTPDNVPYRWADTRDGKPAQVLAFNLSQERRTARVQFTLFNYKSNRTVAVALNTHPLTTFTLAPDASQEVTLDVEMPPGMSTFTFSSPEPPLLVQSNPNQGRDNRLLSFGLRQVRITPASA